MAQSAVVFAARSVTMRLRRKRIIEKDEQASSALVAAVAVVGASGTSQAVDPCRSMPGPIPTRSMGATSLQALTIPTSLQARVHSRMPRALPTPPAPAG